MKFYKFNYYNEIEECEVVKEIKRIYIYNFLYSKINFIILKKNLDVLIGVRFCDVVVIFCEKFIEIGLLIVDVNIVFYIKELY